MSDSPQTREENQLKALQTMLDIIGDARLDSHFFEPGDARFKDILATTWEELEEKGCLKRMSIWDYRMTARGWIEALEATGRLCNLGMKEQLGRLCAAIKDRCEKGGRHRDGTTIQELAKQSGSSEDWIYNVVETHLLRECLKQVDCDWEPGDEMMKNNIMIPARFGLPI